MKCSHHFFFQTTPNLVVSRDVEHPSTSLTRSGESPDGMPGQDTSTNEILVPTNQNRVNHLQDGEKWQESRRESLFECDQKSSDDESKKCTYCGRESSETNNVKNLICGKGHVVFPNCHDCYMQLRKTVNDKGEWEWK